MKRQCIPTGIVIALLACSSPDTRVQTDVEVPVTVEEVVLQPIESFIMSTGTVNATKDVMLKAEMEGFYRLGVNPRTRQPFALGDHVLQDEVLIYLDNPEQENNIKIESHKLELENAQREYEKQNSLYEKGGVTLRELKTAERSFVDAKYNYDNAQIQLTKLQITAPFDGIIITLPYYTPGEKVPVNSEIVRVMNYKVLNMEVNIPGKHLGEVAAGQSVRVMNYTMPDKKLHGRITQVSPALDPESRTFVAAIDIDNPDELLRPGMFVKAEIVTVRKDSAVVIPKDVILSRRNRKTVFVVTRGVAREHRIDTGLENPDVVEVTDGLDVNERLVVKGFETLRNGSRVKITQ